MEEGEAKQLTMDFCDMDSISSELLWGFQQFVFLVSPHLKIIPSLIA